MQNVLSQNKYLWPIVITAVFSSSVVLFLTEYCIYYLSLIFILTAVAIFFEKLKKNSHLLVWASLFTSFSLGGPREVEDIIQLRVDIIRGIRILLMSGVFLIILYKFTMHKFKNTKEALKGPLGWYLIYAVIAMVSSTYSGQPLISLWKGFEVFVHVVTAIYILQKLKSYQDIKRFWNLNMIFLFSLVVSTYLGAIFLPSEAFREVRGAKFQLLSGVYPLINSNSLAQMAAILIIVYFIRYIFAAKNNFKFLLLIFSILPVLILSYGRTSILSLLISLLLLFVFNKRYRYLFVLSMISIFIFWLDGYSYIKLFFERGGSLYTLSGRLDTWPSAWELFKESPIYGYGFYTAVRIICAAKVKIESFSTTDNTYFDVLLFTGILGFIPFVMMLLSFTKRMLTGFSLSRSREIATFKWELLCVAVIILFRSLTGPSIQVLHWNLTVFLAIIICLQGIKKYENPPNPQLS